MKNCIVANFREDNNRYTYNSLFTLVKVQIENSLELGWKPKDILLISNKGLEYLNIRSRLYELNDFCFTGSKLFAIQRYFNSGEEEPIWSHDLDSWADTYFECPEFNDVGITEYSRPKINGGSVFWKNSAIDIINDVVDNLKLGKEPREEPTLQKVLKKYPSRVTVLNNTYNVGCSGYVPRYIRSIKPIHVFHFHPSNTIAWETHILDRAGIGGRISKRLETLIRKYYPNLATELSPKGKFRREQKIAERKK
jgi:hypothetical protein